MNRSRRGDSLVTKDKSFFGHIRKSIEFDRIQLAGAMRCYVKLAMVKTYLGIPVLLLVKILALN